MYKNMLINLTNSNFISLLLAAEAFYKCNRLQYAWLHCMHGLTALIVTLPSCGM